MANNFVFEKANDQHVRSLKVFAKAADSKLYYESDYKTQVKQEDAEYYFAMGALVVKTAAGMSAPVSVNGTKVLTVALSSGTLSGTEWTVKAAE